ncbi:hypothetical protein F3Y22_tig00110831pilonHSYRG00068 [Hibiscus syriacus]|uniref:Uncharacterized protein n=1 Tax=Hibiscus syriacus TaxID=106335 RepID=A0A6A2ZLZ0_HIBSY|nr:hypothetical protein F3Y22_tig00110831pilonHSYRG00068 [Hibiscus syriacus]
MSMDDEEAYGGFGQVDTMIRRVFVPPIMAEYWEKAEFPFQIIPKLGALSIAGGTIKGYGCPGL